MKKINLLLFPFLFLISCSPEEDEFRDINLPLKTEIKENKKKNEANNRIRVKNIESLRKLSLPKESRKEVAVLGYYEPHDGGGGIFSWNSSSTEKDNGGTVITSEDNEFGRWERIYDNIVNVKWFGAKGDGITDDTENLQNAFFLGKKVELPKTDEFYLVKRTLSVKSDVTSAGAVLFSDQPGIRLLEIKANNITLNGLRIIGHDTIIGQETYNPKVTGGIVIKNYNSLTVVNCEIAGWSYCGIYIFNSVNNSIINNYIHHNQRKGLGYGIVVHNKPFITTNALISCNFFEFNRHDIAGSGNEGLSYEASYNVVGLEGGENHHRFDMHGKGGDKEKVAGTKIVIHHNSFLSDKSYAVRIRGIPEEGAEIYANEFRHANIDKAFLQTVLGQATYERINIYIEDNFFGEARKNLNFFCKK